MRHDAHTTQLGPTMHTLLAYNGKKPTNETELTRPAQPRYHIQRHPCLSLMHT
eukprot:COSAG02_NODE_22574_length_747_cov_2.382716_2_plen_52_part_01